MTRTFDAVVIGSGVGGMCTAALLTHAGLRVLLAEKRKYLGGRFSTVDHGGYLCATGGLAVPVGHNLERVCEHVGIPSQVRPATRVAMWLDQQFYDISNGGTRAIIRQVASDRQEAGRVIGALDSAIADREPGNDICFRDWLKQYTRNPRIHGIFQATISSLLTVNSHELPAGEYFKVLKVISPLTFGFIEGGSLALWQRMARFVRANGGEVWTSAIAEKIHVENHRVAGVRLRRGGISEDIGSPLAISNIGPGWTAGLVEKACLAAGYRETLRATMTPTTILWMHFCSDELLIDYSAVSIAGSRRVNMIDVPSREAKGIAPPGKHLYTVGAAPLNSLEPGDARREFDQVMLDLNDIIPEFEQRCVVLSKSCFQGKWPGFRTVPGKNAGHLTPITGLYNVGDAACPSGYAGSMGAAKSAQLVTEAILSGT